MESTLKLMAYAAAAAICMALAPSANGCGRQVLPGLVSSAAAQARAEEPRASQSPNSGLAYEYIVGLWLSTATVDGQPFAQGIEAFTSDGIEMLNSNTPPQDGNVCLGVWAPTGKNTLAVNHPTWNYDNNGNVIGTVIIKSQIAIQSGGNTYKGTFTLDVYDLNGNKVAPTTTGQLTGQRITAN